MNDKLVTFVIPSVARKTLNRSINSLKNQETDNWLAIIGFDGILKENINFELDEDERLKYLFLDKSGELKDLNRRHSKAGQVRNKIMQQVNTQWIAFLDDDDTVSLSYTAILEKEINQNNADCYVFRMIAANGDIIPEENSKKILLGKVGISFCIKRDFIQKNNILFNNSQSEDYEFLKCIANCSGKIKLLNDIGYYVEDRRQ